jgi:hypothetical protein
MTGMPIVTTASIVVRNRTAIPIGMIAGIAVRNPTTGARAR